MDNNQSSNIYCKVEIIQKPISKDLGFTIHLDSEASNVIQGDQEIEWMPTQEEQKFLSNVFQLLSQQPQSSNHSSLSTLDPHNENEEQPSQEGPSSFQTEDTIEKTIEKHKHDTDEYINPSEKIEHIINKQKTSST